MSHHDNKDVHIASTHRVAEDWTALEGLDVEVFHAGIMIDGGRVDAVTPNGNVLWLMNDGASSRRIIEKLPHTLIRSEALVKTNTVTSG